MARLNNQTSKYRPRWFQVSMRTFTVFMLLVGMLFGTVGVALQRGREQAHAVREIESVGGTVTFHSPSNFMQRNDWLRKTFGANALLDVESIDYGRSLETNADLMFLKRMPKLRRLKVHSGQVTDAGLKHLAG